MQTTALGCLSYLPRPGFAVSDPKRSPSYAAQPNLRDLYAQFTDTGPRVAQTDRL